MRTESASAILLAEEAEARAEELASTIVEMQGEDALPPRSAPRLLTERSLPAPLSGAASVSTSPRSMSMPVKRQPAVLRRSNSAGAINDRAVLQARRSSELGLGDLTPDRPAASSREALDPDELAAIQEASFHAGMRHAASIRRAEEAEREAERQANVAANAARMRAAREVSYQAATAEQKRTLSSSHQETPRAGAQ